MEKFYSFGPKKFKLAFRVPNNSALDFSVLLPVTLCDPRFCISWRWIRPNDEGVHDGFRQRLLEQQPGQFQKE
jgi:hypothetical protein